MLTLVTALLCEARPIISHYKLKKITDDHCYPIYTNNEISLIISGVGKTASASATAYSHALKASPAHSCWLNIGIAGHSQLEICSGFLVNKITDNSTRQTWFPALLFEPPCTTDQLLSVDRPDNTYQFLGGIDMEASGFYSTACRFTTSELIHCYKVVSDNPQSPVKKISTNDVSDLVANKIQDIRFLVEQLLNTGHELATQHKSPLMLDKITDQIKLTHSEQRLINNQLRKLQLLNPVALTDFSQLDKTGSASEVLDSITDLLEQQKINF